MNLKHKSNRHKEVDINLLQKEDEAGQNTQSIEFYMAVKE
jgi:hypothetical protein